MIPIRYIALVPSVSVFTAIMCFVFRAFIDLPLLLVSGFAYIVHHTDTVQVGLQKVTPISNPADYLWPHIAATNSELVANYLLQVKFSGRSDIYEEELLALISHVGQTSDQAMNTISEGAKRTLWGRLEYYRLLLS